MAQTSPGGRPPVGAPMPNKEEESRDAGGPVVYLSLHDAQQFNQEIIDCAAEGIIVYDRELRYQVWNPFMEQLTGRRAEEVLGKLAVEVFPFLRENGMEAALKRALQGEV